MNMDLIPLALLVPPHEELPGDVAAVVQTAFNLNGEVGDTALDRKVSKRLARYLLRPAMAESRIVRYEPGTGVVVFRIRGYKDPKTGKRPPAFTRLPAAEFLARLLVQTPPKGSTRTGAGTQPDPGPSHGLARHLPGFRSGIS